MQIKALLYSLIVLLGFLTGITSISSASGQVSPVLPDSVSKTKQLEKENDSLKKVLAAEKNLILKTISEAALTETNKQNVGLLSIKGKGTAIKYDKWDKRYKETLTIKKVDINILDGTIYSIQVFTDDDTIYSNTQSQISLNAFNNRHKDKLYEEDRSSGNYYIQLGDFLRYQAPYGKKILPDDTTVTLIHGTIDTVTLMLDPSLSNLIEGRIYSDVLGLSGRANGIIQTEISTKFNANTLNFPYSRYVPVNYVSPYFSFSKFDSEFDTIALRPDTSLSRMQLLQSSRIQYGIALNLISYFRVYRFEINSGLQGNVVRNILFPDSTVSDINHYAWYLQMGGVFTKGKNYGLDVSLKYIHSWLADQPELNPVKTRRSIGILSPEANIYWYPGNNKYNKIFFRYRGFYNISHSDTNFIQLQFGYSFNINKLFKQ